MVAGTLVLAGCGGGSDSTADDTTMMPPTPTAFDAALEAINAATSAADARAAYEDVDKEAISGAEAAQLMDALNARLTTLLAAEQTAALMTAAAAVDTSNLTTQADVDAARLAIATLQGALDAASHVSAADRTRYQTQLDAANADVLAAVEHIATQRHIADQLSMVRMAANALDTSGLTTPGAIADAQTAITALETALNAAVDVSDADLASYRTLLNTARNAVVAAQADLDTMDRQDMQRMAITNAVETANTAVRAVNNESDDAAVMAADNAVTALDEAIKAAADLSSGDTVLATAVARLEDLEVDLENAKTARQAALNAIEEERKRAEEEARQMAEAAMRAYAKRLYDGIAAQMGNANSPAANDRAAAYNDAGTPTGAAVDTRILVTIGEETGTPTPVVLSEDKKTMVADNHGWAGKRYMFTDSSTSAETEGDMYEALVYSNVEDPTPGRKFGSADVPTAANDFLYQLSNGVLAEATTEGSANLVGGSGFDQSAGIKSYPLQTNAVAVMVPGTFHGVSGTYSCTPSAATVRCASQVAADGFTLGQVTVPTDGSTPVFTASDGTWTFRPADGNARVVDSKDTAYASYGWWIKSDAHGPIQASAFHDVKGTVPDAAALDALNGTATYEGGAVGQYALFSSTGGTNDAGTFTARATLEADFTVNTGTDNTTNGITGTIDEFIGADGESRDWSVALGGSPIADGGSIGDATNGTTWTIGEDAASASGQWSGQFRKNGDDGVPEVVTGTFHTVYGSTARGGSDGQMVGAFGANKQ